MPRINSLGEANKILQAQAKRIEALEKFKEDMMPWASILAFYKGSDRRKVPCIITGAFPNAGTIDVIVFDNMDSGGGRAVDGTYIGEDVNQVAPILRVDEENEELEEEGVEDEDEQLVAS